MPAPDSGDWLQFYGALLAAGIAIVLWVSEKIASRIEANAVNQRHRREFTAVVGYALQDIRSQLKSIEDFGAVCVQNYAAIQRSSKREDHDAFVASVTQRFAQSEVHLTPILDFSGEHARFLSPDQNRRLGQIIREVRTLNSLLRTSRSDTTAGVSGAAEALDIVLGMATQLSTVCEALSAELGSPSDVAAQRSPDG